MSESERAMVVREARLAEAPLNVQDLARQVCHIQEVMRAVMKEGEHYGKIPGCGDKRALLKPGAEKLMLTFRLVPRYHVTMRDLGQGHREYEVVTELTNQAGEELGQGLGSASTMEGKWRYRSESTGRDVPADYWKARDTALLGGPQFHPKKVRQDNGAQKWIIFQRVEHDNPADYYNTVLKMASKRSLVHAVLTRTAASDIFVQDEEDIERRVIVVDSDVDRGERTTSRMSEAAPDDEKAPPPRRAQRPPPDDLSDAGREPTGPDDGAEIWRGVRVEVKEHHSPEGAPRPWTRWEVRTDTEQRASTFDSKMGEALVEHAALEQEIDLMVRPGKKAGTWDIVRVQVKGAK